MSELSRRELLKRTGWAVGTGMLASRAALAQTAPTKPNIVFILADDLGYGDLGCFGQKQIQTPNLDRMAVEGTRFTQCYAGSTVCAPSRCALMTGLHTGHCWIRGNDRVPLRPEDRTVAEVLKAAGYKTALIGKWGLGEPETTGVPNRKGFDYFFGYLNQAHAHNYYPDHLWRNEEKVPLEGNVDVEGVSTQRAQYSHDLFTRDALDYLGRQSGEQPFFLYLAYTIPHANNERGKAEGDGMEVPDYGPYADRDWPGPEKGRAAMITRMDRDIGALFACLQDRGLDENTLVVFTSDNGPHKEGGADADFFDSNGPLRGIKRDLYEGGIRVPTLARWPGHVPAGATRDTVWASWDFLPTAAELAGVPAPAGLDGVSVVPALLGQGEPQERAPLYWEFHEGGFVQAARKGPWKAVRKGLEGEPELYNLDADPGESRNLAAEQPGVVKEMADYLNGARTDNPHWKV